MATTPTGRFVLADVADQRGALAVHLGQIEQDGIVMARLRLEALDCLSGRPGTFHAQIGIDGAEFAPNNVGLASVSRDVENVHVSLSVRGHSAATHRSSRSTPRRAPCRA